MCMDYDSNIVIFLKRTCDVILVVSPFFFDLQASEPRMSSFLLVLLFTFFFLRSWNLSVEGQMHLVQNSVMMCEKKRRQDNYGAAILIRTETLLCERTHLSRTSTRVSHRHQNLLQGEMDLDFQQGLKTFHISNNPGLYNETFIVGKFIHVDFQWDVKALFQLDKAWTFL